MLFNKDVLPNGIRVITEELPFVHSVSIGIWVGTGSRHENLEINGVSHFLEHMLFKGTNKRTAKEIAESMEAVGGQLNAFTSKEHTCYYAKVLSENFDLAADVLSDMLLNSKFDAEEMNKERNVILEEIKMYEDTPDELIHDIYAKVMWQGDSLGQSIIGTVGSVGALTREQLLKYYTDTYVPGNIVIAVVGNIKRAQVLEKVEKLFSTCRGQNNSADFTQPKTYSGATFVSKDIEQVHLCLGIPGLSSQDPNIYSLYILNNILGGGISSRLFQEIREDRGLTYSIYSYHSGYSNTGLFGVYAGTSMRSFDQVLDITLKQISDIKRNGITKGELERTKQQIKGSILLGLENVGSRMNRLGKSEISYGRIITPEEIVDSIMRVTNESVIDVARQIFHGNRFVLAVIGPEQMKLELSDVVERAGI